MTKEDEARLATIQDLRRRDLLRGNEMFLLRLLDEQAARVAALEAQVVAMTAAGNAIAGSHRWRCENASCADCGNWEAAIRARAGSPAKESATAALARLGFEPRDEGLDGAAPVAPGESKP